MSQQGQWITLDSVINDYLVESEQSNNKYFKLFHLAFRGLEDLGMDFFYQIKSVKLPVNANKTIDLPADYLNYTKIGVLNGRGEVVPLKYNDNLSFYKDDNPNRVSDISAQNFANMFSFSSPVFYNFWDGDSYNTLYGVNYSGIYGGGFKIDTTNRVMLLDTTYGYDNIVLEYTASPMAGEEYYVPVQFREALVTWLAWKDVANSVSNTRKISGGEKDMRRRIYFNERRRAIGKYRPFYLDQAYMASQDNSRLVVKA